MERAAELVAVQRRGLRVAERQLAVAAQPAPEEEHVPGAVHRLERELLLLVAEDEEHVLAVVLVVARGDVGVDVVDERRLHLDVAALRVLAAAEVLERVPDHHALRVPERRPRRVVGEVEEVELRPEPAVVARARLLEPLEVRVEIVLRVERGAVDPGQLRVLLVAAPVRAREAGQLDRLDRLRVLQVRAAAEVGEVALRVERDRALGGVDELDLVRLALLLEAPRASSAVISSRSQARPSFSSRPISASMRSRSASWIGSGKLEVVVEAVLDRRPDRDLHAGVEPPHRLGEQVRGRVAEDVERVRIVLVAGRQDLDLLAVGERQAQVADVAVRADEHRLLGELRADRARASSPVAPSGSSSSELSGRTTFMEEQDTSQPREDDRNDELDDSPAPDPEEKDAEYR